MNMLQKRVNQRGQGGFTLIELLVVIAILAILAGVVVFAVGNTTDNAKVTACKAEMKTVSVAANAAKAGKLSDPATSVFDFIDGAPAAGPYNGEYVTVTETGTGVTFAATAAATALGTDCTLATAVTY